MSENNGHLEHIYERSQKLTEALYRVTDLFSDSEPLKWLLRRDGLEIFESLLGIKTAPTNERVRGLSRIADKIRQTVKVFELAASGSFISDANFQVLKREYLALADYLAERKGDILPEQSAIGFIGHQHIGQITNGHQNIGGQSLALSTKENGQSKALTSEKKNEDKNNEPIENGEVGGENETKGSGGRNRGNGDRREEIISLIKERDWTSVGEIAEAFKGRIGEKTLQRDLVSMAGSGLLLKEGEKRWRRYKLAV